MKVTERGIQVLKGQEAVYRKEPKKVQQLSDEETDTLFEVLRELRTDLASEAGVPPYVVFSDSTLKEMSRIRPSSRLEMLQIKGVGQSKLDKYGEAFLSRIKIRILTFWTSKKDHYVKMNKNNWLNLFFCSL